MTLSLEIRYRMPVPLLSVLHFSGGRTKAAASAASSSGNTIQSDVDFFDVRNNVKFSARGIFARPKVAAAKL